MWELLSSYELFLLFTQRSKAASGFRISPLKFFSNSFFEQLIIYRMITRARLFQFLPSLHSQSQCAITEISVEAHKEWHDDTTHGTDSSHMVHHSTHWSGLFRLWRGAISKSRRVPITFYNCNFIFGYLKMLLIILSMIEIQLMPVIR